MYLCVPRNCIPYTSYMCPVSVSRTCSICAPYIYVYMYVYIYVYICAPYLCRTCARIYTHTRTIRIIHIYVCPVCVRYVCVHAAVEKLVQSVLSHEQTNTFFPPMEEEDAIQSIQVAPRQEPPKSPQAHILKSALCRHISSSYWTVL